ncbi:uncharacterized protein LOC106163877 [Lingula anatina]|uniref:Uncharacterized protein LOC106163877 n=1 Tax=Lingula anatina TaxID=7574 RepID=A0A1S3IFJ8_LINAN|nr:uncharacterized protein LOC106163877 [Lingula anatina]|eukprot:XP_013397040.1 uncharacterized protein LOC106163877 [Lingula anatina]
MGADKSKYTVTPVGHIPYFVVEIRGINLNSKHISQETIDMTRILSHQNRILIFKDQGIVPAKVHIRVGEWFGPIQPAEMYSHPRAPHPQVLRLSNDPEEGCVNIGTRGWHIDGSYLMVPYHYSLYHMVALPTGGSSTLFYPLFELIKSLDSEQLSRWQRLWIVRYEDNKKRVHPVIYVHPVTGLETMCIHLGGMKCFVWDRGTPEERWTAKEETDEIVKEIQQAFDKNQSKLMYEHKWEPGDFIISDNLSVAHLAGQAARQSRKEVGLRILHRVSVAGTHRPQKEFRNYVNTYALASDREMQSQGFSFGPSLWRCCICRNNGSNSLSADRTYRN